MQTMVPLYGFGGVPYSAVRKAAPRNLLDNSDFRNPVNQRGQTSYTGAGYTIDRWYAITEENNFTVNNGSVTISGFVRQKIIAPDGRYTIAAKTTDGDVYTLEVELSNNTVTNISGVGDLYVVFEGDYYAVGVNSGNYLWVALYEGSYTAETLPEYQPKGYGAELAECQRYFQNISVARQVVTQATAGFEAVVPLYAPMRITPTVILASAPTWIRMNNTHVALSDAAFSGVVGGNARNALTITLKTAASIAANSIGYVDVLKVLLSADL